jgi:hypothetical protein
MRSHFIKSTAALALSVASLGAFASTYDGECTDRPKSEWMSTDRVKAHFDGRGFSVGKVKAAGSCYEVYAKDTDGNKIELFVNPVDATVVGQAGKK